MQEFSLHLFSGGNPRQDVLNLEFFIVVYLLNLHELTLCCNFAHIVAVLSLCCCVSFCLVAESRGYSRVVVHRLLIVVASLVDQHGLQAVGFSS